MSPLSRSILDGLKLLIQRDCHEARHVAASDMPDTEEGHDLGYEERIAKEFDEAVEAASEDLSSQYGAPLPKPKNYWASLAVFGWEISPGKVVCLFVERDDCDCPLVLNIGLTDRDRFENAEDPWDYDRSEVPTN
jgi:hypothetical protein